MTDLTFFKAEGALPEGSPKKSKCRLSAAAQYPHFAPQCQQNRAISSAMPPCAAAGRKGP